MKTKKNVLIVTDGSESIASIAAGIARALKGNKVLIVAATEFKGNDLLPADVFFLGCEKPCPDSFAYIEDLLKHINLAGRSCGVFTVSSKKAANYLASIIRDSGAAISPEPLFYDSQIETWALNVISGSFR